ESGRGGDAAIVADPSFAIEDGHSEPGVVGAEAGSPYHRLDLAAAKIEGQRRRRLDRSRGKAMRRIDLAVDVIGVRPGVDSIEQPVHLEVGQLAHVAQ